MNITLNATTIMSPPMTPPAIAGALDLREDVEGVGDAECEDGVEDGMVECSDVGVGVATINSGL
jgi:hypothetical protein